MQEPTNRNSVEPWKERNSPVTPATPEAPFVPASLTMRVNAAKRPSWIACVTCGTSPPSRLLMPAPSEPRKPMELTLLPTTISPAE